MTTIPDTPITIPTSPRTEAARQALPQIRTIIEGLEGLTFLSPGERLRVNTSANINDRFLEVVAAAIEGSALLEVNAKVTPAELREIIGYRQAGFALADELERLTRGIRDTVKVHSAKVATEALRVFGVAQKINRPGDREELVPTLDQMQRALGRGRRKAVPKADPAQPAAA